MADEAKIHGRKLGKFQPDPMHPRYVVDCRLEDMNTTRDIFWSQRKNSYVLTEVDPKSWEGHPEMLDRYYWKRGDKHFQLVSINGAGEVRWDVTKDRIEYMLRSEQEYPTSDGDHVEFLAALRHFGLIPART